MIPTDVRKGNGDRKVQSHGHGMKGFAHLLTVLPGIALISAN